MNHLKDQRKGQIATRQAIENGSLVRPDTCQACNYKPKNDYIVAHHWQGYSNPLDVLWICRSCNRLLAHKHDGSMTLDQIREFVKGKKKPKPYQKGFMKSRIGELARSNGYSQPSELVYILRMPNHHIKALWDGYLDNVYLGTMVKFRNLFGCDMEDLFVYEGETNER